MERRIAWALAAVLMHPSLSLGDDAATMQTLNNKIAERDRLQAEINLLRADANVAEAIYVNVQVLEVNLDALRSLDADFSTADGQKFLATDFADMLASGRVDELHADAVRGVVEMLLAKNVAKLRANPQLVTVSGRPASFHVGGKAPVVAAPGVNQAPQFLNFGTQLDLTAESLGDRQVRLSIGLELSELDSASTVVTEDGWRVPAVDSTKCNTTCSMRFGEAATLSYLRTARTASVVQPDGSQAEVTERFATWIVVHAADDVPAAPNAGVVPAEHVEAVKQ